MDKSIEFPFMLDELFVSQGCWLNLSERKTLSIQSSIIKFGGEWSHYPPNFSDW